MSLRRLVKHECQKNGFNVKYIVINDNSQRQYSQHLRRTEIRYYTFIIQSAVKTILPREAMHARY